MANKREIADILIKLDVQQAQDGINKLLKESKRLEQQLDEMGKGDPEARRKVNEQLQQTEAQVLRLRESLKTDMRVIINGETAGKSIKEIETALKILQRELRAINDPSSQEFLRKSQQAAVLQTKLEDLKKPIKEFKDQLKDLGAEGSLLSLKDKATRLRSELDKLAPSTKQFADKAKELQQVESQLNRLNSTVKGSTGFFQILWDQFKQFGALASVYLGFQFITSQVGNMITRNAKLSDSLADLQRVTGMTAEEAKNLNKELSQIGTRTSTQSLREIAIVSGKLGVASEDIAKFTENVNMLVVTLGDELGNAEQITETLGKILNVFQGKITTEGISQLGNAVVQLANAGVATGGFIANFTQRLSGIASAANISLSATVGLGAGLEELGQRVESSSTAVSKLIVKIGEDVPKAAKIAGANTVKQVEEFTQLFATKPEEALIRFAEGLQKNKSSFSEIALSFKDAGEEGARVISTLAQLGLKGDFLREKITLAGVAIQDTTAITAAYELKNSTMGANLEKLGKKVAGLFTGQGMNDFFAGAITSTINFVDALKRLPKFISDNSTAFYTLIAALAMYNATLIKATLTSIVETTATLANAAAKRASAFATNLSIAAQSSYITVTSLLTGRITLATAAQRLYNAVFSANPIGLAITAFVALAGAVALYTKNTTAALALEKDKNELAKTLAATNSDLSKTIEVINKQLTIYNTLGTEERTAMVENIRLKKEEAIATLKLAKAKQEEIRAKSSTPTVMQTIGNAAFSFANPIAFASAQATDAVENGQEAAAAYTETINDLDAQIKQLSGTYDTLQERQNAESTAMAINAESTDQYNEKLRLLRVALNDAKIESEDYDRISREIAETQKKMGAAGTPGKPTAEQIKEAEAALAKLKTLIKDLHAFQINSIKDTQERELALFDEKHREDAEKEKLTLKASVAAKLISQDEANQLLLDSESRYQLDRNALIDKQRKELSEKEFKQDTDNLKVWHDTEKVSISQQYADGLLSKAQYTKALEKLEEDTLKYKLQIAKDYGKSEAEITQAGLDAKILANTKDVSSTQDREKEKIDLQLKMTSEYSEKNLDLTIQAIEHERDEKLKNYVGDAEMRKLIEDEANQEIENARAAHTDKLLQLVMGYVTQVTSIMQGFDANALAKEQKALSQEQKRNEQKKKDLKKLLDSKQITEKEYNEQIEAMDLDMDKKQRALKQRAWESQHRADILQSIINTALAVSRAISTPPAPNIGLGLLAGVLGAAQTVVIESQEPPEFGKGKHAGFIESGKGGNPEGPSHDEGGILLVDSSTNRIIGEMEGDEPILSKKTYENNTAVIDALLNSSMNHDGRKVTVSQFSKYQYGKASGYASMPQFAAASQPQVNAERIIENIMRQFIIGAIPQHWSTDGRAIVQSNIHGLDTPSTDARQIGLGPAPYADPRSVEGRAIVNILQEIKGAIEDPSNRVAKLDYYDYTETSKKIDQAKGNARVG